MTGASNGTQGHDGGVGDGGGTTAAVRDGGSARSGSGDAGRDVAVTLRPVQLPSAPAAETTVLLGMLERASGDPTVDIERMERMFALYERAAARSAKSAFIDALMKAKGELPRVIRTGSASYDDKKTGEKKEAFRYAKWEEVCVQIEPVLARHGLVLTFSSEQPTADRVNVTGILSHRDGHSERAQMALGCDASGGKNNAQGWGSAISYGKRYTAFALLNLVGHDDKDTDAAPPPAETISEEQEDTIREALEAKDISLSRFCGKYKIDKLGDLPAVKYADALAAIRRHGQ